MMQAMKVNTIFTIIYVHYNNYFGLRYRILIVHIFKIIFAIWNHTENINFKSF